jgi:hypothetical protein
MREQQAEIDAIVLNLSASLSNTQLDALFAVVTGDYNGDHVVDVRDYLVWRKSVGQHVTAWTGADGNGDGVVDNNDYNIWRSNFGATGSGSGSIASAEIPEPPSVVVACIGLLGTVRGRKQKTVNFQECW